MLYFVKQSFPSAEYDNLTDWICEEAVGYQGVIPDIATNGYSVYVRDHLVDIFIFSGTGKGIYSATHLCLEKNSCISESIKFIDKLKKKPDPTKQQLSLF
jgi:hypothetical protein